MSSDNTDFITIIIPAYNCEPYIERCLDSVLDAIDADCEVVVVDDGSDDATLEKARAYEDMDARISVITTPHVGVGHARKTGFDSSSGDYVIFLDADDTMPSRAIAEFRRASAPDVDIVIGNVSVRHSDGSNTLTLTGAPYTLDSEECLKRILLGEIDYSILGKMYRRNLFDTFFWDTNPIYAGLFQRALLLSLVCGARNRIVVSPSVHAMTHILRPWSLSAMLQLRAEGIDRLWQTVSVLPLPRRETVIWGLDLLDKIMMQRGLPFSNSFTPAVEIRSMARGLDLDERHRRILDLLKSEKLRLRTAQRAMREEGLTMVAPHLSFVIVCGNNTRRVERTVESLFSTGFRNIEIILVDTGHSDEVSIRLNAICIMHNRVMLVKQPAGDSRHSPYLTGFKASRGYAICFLRPGDVVSSSGILEVLRHVDIGTDICFMSYEERHNGTGLPLTRFDSSSITAIHDGSEAAFDALLGRGGITQGVYAFIAKRSVIRTEHFNNVDPCCYEIAPVMVLKLLADRPAISASSVLALHRHRYSPAPPYLERCIRMIALGRRIIDVLGEVGLDDPGRRRRIGEGLVNGLVSIVSERASIPFRGMHAANDILARVVALPEFVEFFAEIPGGAPQLPILQHRIRVYTGHNRGILLKRALLRC